MNIKTFPETWAMKRAGFKRVVLNGRASSSPQDAIYLLRESLRRDGITVPDEDIWAVEETPGAICPWGAYALIPE